MLQLQNDKKVVLCFEYQALQSVTTVVTMLQMRRIVKMCKCLESKKKELENLGFENVEIKQTTIAKHGKKGRAILQHIYCPWCGQKL